MAETDLDSLATESLKRIKSLKKQRDAGAILNLSVSFHVLEDEADVPVEVSPAVDGRWRWIGTRTLRFEVVPGEIDRLPPRRRSDLAEGDVDVGEDGEAETLWTEVRTRKIIDAAVQYKVAIEINSGQFKVVWQDNGGRRNRSATKKDVGNTSRHQRAFRQG